jgi:RNA polymerase sigma-70 factor (ECF subfamily)
VWAYAAAQAGWQIADEVVSETFTVAWRRLADVPDPPLPWLLGVARNVLRGSFRAQARRDALAAELRSWADPAAYAGSDVGETVTDRLAVLGALASLSADDCEVLILAAWQGLTMREAAQVTGSTAGAMRVRLHRARGRLKHALGTAETRSRRAIDLPAPGVPAMQGETS